MKLRDNSLMLKAAAGLSIILLTALGYYSYRTWAKHKNSLAGDAYVRLSLKISDIDLNGIDAFLQDVDGSYATYQTSSYAPLFLALKARLLLLKGDVRGAADLFEQISINGKISDQALQDMYAISAAVMNLDDANLGADARALLEKYAQSDSISAGMAAYYLGLYGHCNGDQALRDASWNSLFDFAGKPLGVWGSLASQLKDVQLNSINEK